MSGEQLTRWERDALESLDRLRESEAALKFCRDDFHGACRTANKAGTSWRELALLTGFSLAHLFKTCREEGER